MAWKNTLLIILVAYLTYHVIERFDVSDDDSLDGKNVLITGASSGIGEQMAFHYARNGANVFITARREQLLEKVTETCKSLGQSDRKYGFLAADMGIRTDRERVIEVAFEFFGDLDQLILNHAQLPTIYKWTGTKEHLDILDSMLNVNVQSYVHMTGLALPSLRRTSGSIAVVGSGAGRMPTPYTLEYSTSKFALDGFFSGLRYEFKATKENISITHCIIGFISTEQSKDSQLKLRSLAGPRGQYLLDAIPMATPEDAAQAIAKATTLRQGELYFPWYQMLWLASVQRSISPELENLDIMEFGQT